MLFEKPLHPAEKDLVRRPFLSLKSFSGFQSLIAGTENNEKSPGQFAIFEQKTAQNRLPAWTKSAKLIKRERAGRRAAACLRGRREYADPPERMEDKVWGM